MLVSMWIPSVHRIHINFHSRSPVVDATAALFISPVVNAIKLNSVLKHYLLYSFTYIQATTSPSTVLL